MYDADLTLALSSHSESCWRACGKSHIQTKRREKTNSFLILFGSITSIQRMNQVSPRDSRREVCLPAKDVRFKLINIIVLRGALENEPVTATHGNDWLLHRMDGWQSVKRRIFSRFSIFPSLHSRMRRYLMRAVYRSSRRETESMVTAGFFRLSPMWKSVILTFVFTWTISFQASTRSVATERLEGENRIGWQKRLLSKCAKFKRYRLFLTDIEKFTTMLLFAV